MRCDTVFFDESKVKNSVCESYLCVELDVLELLLANENTVLQQQVAIVRLGSHAVYR